jgi:PKD repeat protein
MAAAALAMTAASAQQDDEIPTTPQTFYIDQTHAGVEVGTSDQPFRSIFNALLKVLPDRGDTLIVRPGEYDENFLIPPGTTLRSELGPYETALVSNSPAPETILGMTADTLLSGFRVGPSLGDGLVVLDSGRAEVRNCVFVGTVRALAVQGGGRLWSYNNTFHGNQVSLQGEANARLVDVRNNIFADDGVGILLDAGATLQSAYNNFDGFGPPVFGGVPGALDYSRDSAFAGAEAGLFHLRGTSPVRDAGDPAAPWNDRDGTRNDLGADGGPGGDIDVIAPSIALSVTPQSGPEPLRVSLDASASFDDWGLSSLVCDFDISDGADFSDAIGASVVHTYGARGGYFAAVKATDDRGNVSVAYLPAAIGVGGVPSLDIVADVRAGDAPFAVGLSVLSGADLETVAWDFGEDGLIDTSADTVVHTVPAGTPSGLYGISAFATDAQGRRAHARIDLTVTETPVLGEAALAAGSGAVLRIDTPSSPLSGGSLVLPADAVNVSGRATLGEYARSAFPFYPEGEFLRVIEVGPQQVTLGDWAGVTIPVPAFDAEELRRAHVFRFDRAANIWRTTGIRGVRVLNSETEPAVSFQIAQGGAFAIVGEPIPTGPFGCHQLPERKDQANPGSFIIFGAAACVMALGARRKR